MTAVALLGLLAIIATGVLVFARQHWTQDEDTVANAINQRLPQTQCAQCGYPGCRPYAEAIAAGDAAINLCPPGGAQTVERLADLLGVAVIPLAEAEPEPVVARIREAECIGCTLCIQACPVDAIMGATQQMHTVIENQCTGCELCLPPCPVDCIDLVNVNVISPYSLPDYSQPCIHCGFCADVCPKSLAPQQLLLHSHEPDLPDSFRLDDCVECFLCDRTCPSEIPLTLTFRSMKSSERARQREAELARIAEQRFEQRETRLVREKQKIRKRPGKARSLLADIEQDLST